MALAAALLAEFDYEMAGLRRALERVPVERWDWRPHDRSMRLGALAVHLARIPGWVGGLLAADFYDVSRDETSPAAVDDPRSPEEMVALFDENRAAARRALAACEDATLEAPWALTRGGTTLRALSRGAALRGYVLAHAIHHRGQLTVYLRLLQVPVPALYGSSADEIL